MTQETASDYDAVPYESHAFRASHPDGLAAMANLCGMQPAPAEKCRVLELGCASGGNLIPLAAQFPESTFTGVDLSAVQVADGNALIGKLKLGNIRLLQQSILDVEEREYDYILCHGVYSWVPDPVKEKILSICARQLAPQGVAFVSYNTYPGWHFRGMIRDMMLYHTRRLADPGAKAVQARALLDFLAQAAKAETTYGKMLRDEINTLRQHKDYYLVHEHLEESNHPLYFHEFAARADEHGLKYLGDASISAMMISNFSPEVSEALKQLSHDIIATEQYIDFLTNRTFRQTLLCRKEVALKRALEPEDVTRFLICSPAKIVAAEGAGQEGGNRPARFTTPTGATITPGNPLTLAAFHYLAETWPQAVPFDALLAEAARRGEIPLDAANAGHYRTLLSTDLLTGVVAGIVELQITRRDFVARVSDRPAASELARLQAEKGYFVTSQRHETVPLDVVNRQLIQLLDGKNDRAALLEKMTALVAKGAMRAQLPDGKPIAENATLRAELTRVIDAGLANLAKAAMLVG